MTGPVDIRLSSVGGPRLVRDYLASAPGVMQYFSGPYGALASYRAQWRHLRHRFGREARARAAAALQPTSGRAAERLDRFVEQGGAVVTTGQQAGLFTGPAYTIHKLLAAVALAELLERELNLVVLPVFWVASEDHDWAEVDHTWVLDRQMLLQRLQVKSAERRPLPMSARTFGDGIHAACEEYAQALHGRRYSDDYLSLIREAYTPAASVASAFRRTVSALGAPFDLLTTDAADPALKLGSERTLSAALDGAKAEEDVLRATAQRLLTDGYHVQVAVVSHAPNLFVHTDSGRERLRVSNSLWRTASQRHGWNRAEIGALVHAEPAALSPNALLRPVVESAVFPVLSYVAGPGEISYFAQIADLFQLHGMRMPVVFPRPSVQWGPAGALEVLAEMGVAPHELATPEHALATSMARRHTPPGVDDALASLRATTVDGFAALLEASGGGPAERLALGRIRDRALAEVAAAERELLKHTKRGDVPRLQRLAAARNVLQPHGRPQERVLNALPFLVEYGPNLLTDTADALRRAITSQVA